MTVKTVTYVWRPGEAARPVEQTLEQMSPKDLMLAAMGMCATLTAAALFEKMHLGVGELRVETSGEIEGDLGRADSVFSSFTQRFTAFCSTADRDKVVHALQLTYGKYCGVGTMLARVAPVRYEVEIKTGR